LKLDPDYPAAHAYLAFCYHIRFVHDGRFDEGDKASGIRHARAAIASGVDDATALAVAAITVAHLEKNFDASLDAIKRALSHNASCAAALFFHIAAPARALASASWVFDCSSSSLTVHIVGRAFSLRVGGPIAASACRLGFAASLAAAARG
jgi:hypothetical protein